MSSTHTAYFAIFLVCLLTGCKREVDHSQSVGAIVIGAYLPLTGPTADFGNGTLRGMKLALEHANQHGGAHGRKFRLVVLDDQGKADEAGSAVLRLIDLENVVAVLGEVTSSLSLIGGRICQRREIPMIATSATHVRVTQIGDYIFRACFVDSFQALGMAKFARTRLHLDRIAIFKDIRSDYSMGLSHAFDQAYTSLGGQIVEELSYNQGDTDFSAQLTAIRATSAEAIYMPGYYGEVANIARQARRLGLSQTLLGGDGWDSPQLREIGGNDIVGSYFTNDFSVDSPLAKSRWYVKAFFQKYQERPSGLAAQGHDAAALLVDAIRRAPQVTPLAIARALSQTFGFEGVTGRMSMDKHRNPIKPAVILRIGTKQDEFAGLVEP